MYPIIDFENIKNVRDISYLNISNGKIKKNKLYRGSSTCNATEEELKELYEKYDIRTIVDFRSDNEVKEKPDCLYPGMKYYHIVCVPEGSYAVERDSKAAQELAKFDDSVEYVPYLAQAKMKTIYRTLASSSFSLAAHKKFIEILLENGEHGILWHCAMGKDRAGIASALVEFILGVDEKEMRDDYILSNKAHHGDSKPTNTSRDFFFYAFFDYFDGYIETVYDTFSTIDNYLKMGIGLTQQQIDDFRKMFLD